MKIIVCVNKADCRAARMLAAQRCHTHSQCFIQAESQGSAYPNIVQRMRIMSQLPQDLQYLLIVAVVVWRS